MKFITSLLVFTTLCFFSGCDQKEDFSCDRNAPIEIQKEKICAFARSEYYRHYVNFQTGIEIEEISLFVTYSTGNFTLRVTVAAENGDGSNLRELIKVGQEYTYQNNEGRIIFPGINQTFSGKIIFSSFDRINKKATSTFDFSVESSANPSAPFPMSGSFQEVGFE